MEIVNARINNVSLKFDDRDRLSASMILESPHGCCAWGFILTIPSDVQRLIKLMNYTDSHNFESLNNKIIRIVNQGRLLRGFGHPIEDKFFTALGNGVTEVTEVQFEEFLRNK